MILRTSFRNETQPYQLNMEKNLYGAQITN